MWCSDPDKTFDIGCGNLGCEDTCQNNINCPLKRKDCDMYILVEKEVTLKKIENSDIVIHISSDGKSFSVIKHRYFNSDNTYPISQLQHILMAGREQKKENS